MVHNPETFVLMETIPDSSNGSILHEGEGVVGAFAPIYRTYCKIGSRDDGVLQEPVRSAVRVPGCRGVREDHQGTSSSGKPKDWQVCWWFRPWEIVLRLKCILRSVRQGMHAIKLLQIRKSFTAYPDMAQFRSNERQQSWFTSVGFDASSDGNVGENEDRSSEDDVESNGNENDDGEEEEEEEEEEGGED